MDDRHPFHEGLSLVKKNSLQASQLVKRMVNLHLGQTGERNYHNLNEIAGDLVDLVTKILPRRIQWSPIFPAQLPAYLDVVEFRQVVINLLLNAADAMPRGGRLTLRTSRHEVLPALENMKGMAPRLPCNCLAIEDTGCGIKQRHLASFLTRSSPPRPKAPDSDFTTPASPSKNSRARFPSSPGRARAQLSKSGCPKPTSPNPAAWRRPRRANTRPAATSAPGPAR